MAEYLLVPATRHLIPLGGLDPREVAPLTDAGLTSYHAVKRSVQLLGAGSTAVVIGAGGLGQMAIQVLKALSRRQPLSQWIPRLTSSRSPQRWAPTKG